VRRVSPTSALAGLLALAVVAVSPAPAARRGSTSGPLVAISAKTGVLQAFPRVTGSAVYSIVGDGSGGWFVGGEFSVIGGVTCRNLAHVGGDGTVDRAWCPGPDGTIRALARAGNVLYIGGSGLHHVGGAARAGLAALNVRTGRVTPWNPGATSGILEVLQLTVDSPRNQLLVTGDFTRLAGKPRSHLGAVGLGSGRATRFAPNPDANAHGDSVFGTVSARGAVYAYGFFSRIGGLPRDSFSRLDPRSGRALASVVSPICPTALLASWSRLYAGTDTSCKGAHRPLIAMSLPDLKPVPLPPSIRRRHVEALAAGSGIVVAAAANDHFSEREPRVLIGLAAGRPRFRSAVHPVGPVETLGVSGDVVLVGGLFAKTTEAHPTAGHTGNSGRRPRSRSGSISRA
jgi:hypothetical protein